MRLAVDIGGTFTDVALERAGQQVTTKVLTTSAAPEQGVLAAVDQVLSRASIGPEEIGVLIHGTTLATNALIERKGARTALIVTAGFRDSVEMAYENRFEQYDIGVDRPEPLVPRALRWPVTERLDARGRVLIPLDDDSVQALIEPLRQQAIQSVAIGLIHAYANPVHEQRVAGLLQQALPDLSITLSSAVCPEIREYERQSTTCANAYVQPLMVRYLRQLEQKLRERGLRCPFLLMTSGGGLATLNTAIRFPIRLVESGPAGGAILASRIAAKCGLGQVVAYDMGGTTAKLCLIDDAQPLTSRTFEVARVYRFLKGSGLPIRIPAIEMVEIGAGGGSIAQVDQLGRVQVGPDSAGAEPGPACYGRGGQAPTVTDADVVLGRIDPDLFAGGAVGLQPRRAVQALSADVGAPMALEPRMAAFAVSEMVDENMANAARVHAIEWGKDLSRRTLIAFGGAAPLHAARLAEKLGLDRILIPAGAGVGSAIGFLRAAISYEVVRSHYARLSDFAADPVNALLDEMSTEAHTIVTGAAPGEQLVETRIAYMRYLGQGHEISVAVPVRPLRSTDASELQRAFDKAYDALYGRIIPALDVEILSWTLTVAAPAPEDGSESVPESAPEFPQPHTQREIFDPATAAPVTASVFRRTDLSPGAEIHGPALIVEEQTTTVVSNAFDARVDPFGTLVLTRR